jgi:hypothetical protein
MTTRVSLSSELRQLFQGLIGARILVERLIDSPAEESIAGDGAAHAVVAILALLVERLRLVERVVRGGVDPAFIACRQNEATPAMAGDEPDVFLAVWDDVMLAKHHRTELRRTKRRAVVERGESEAPP